MFLPTETFFDDVSWWSGQFLYNAVASYFFPQQWIQINPIYCENKEHRVETMSGQSSAPAQAKAYKRVISFERPLMWLISSFKLSDIKLATPCAAFSFTFSYFTPRRDWISKFNFNSGSFYPVRQLSAAFPVDKSGIFSTTTIGHVDCCHRCASQRKQNSQMKPSQLLGETWSRSSGV